MESVHSMKTLNNGVEMPCLGFGVYQITDEKELIGCIEKALACGYRSFDTASYYGNEAFVGKALNGSGMKRSELFVTSKLWGSDQGYDRTLHAYEAALKRFQMDYLDLFLVHWPNKEHFSETWKAMERLYHEKQVRAIGVCNYEIPFLDRLLKEAEIPPAVDQVETHPYFSQSALKPYLKRHHIQHESWSPLGKGAVLNNEVLRQIASKKDRTVAQIIIRWHLQRGSVVIPKSSHFGRIEENAQVFDFDLTNEELSLIDSINSNKRVSTDPNVVYEQGLFQ